MNENARSTNDGLHEIKNESEKAKSFLDSMLAFWIVLLLISLGAAAMIYLIWLKDVIV